MVAVVVDFKIEGETLGHRLRIGMNSTKIFTVLTITMMRTIMKVMKGMPQEVKAGYKAPDL